MKTNNCPNCGRGKVVAITGANRRMPYRHIPDLELPADLSIPTCDRCGEQWFDAKTSAAVDAALRDAYQAELVTKATAAIEVLSARYTQQVLERILGLSAGYLSKLKSGKETTAQLAGFLMVLAKDPSRVEELQRDWSTQSRITGGSTPEFEFESVHPRTISGEIPIVDLPRPSAPDYFYVKPAERAG